MDLHGLTKRPSFFASIVTFEDLNLRHSLLEVVLHTNVGLVLDASRSVGHGEDHLHVGTVLKHPSGRDVEDRHG